MRAVVYGTGDSCTYLLKQIDHINRISGSLFKYGNPFGKYIEIVYFAETRPSKEEYGGVRVVAGSDMHADDFDCLILATSVNDVVRDHLRQNNPEFESFEKKIVDYDRFTVRIDAVEKTVHSMVDERRLEIEKSREEVLSKLSGKISFKDDHLIINRDYFSEDTFYIVSGGGIGDILTTCGFIQPFCDKNKIKKKICLITRHGHDTIGQWYPHIDSVVVDEDMMKSLQDFSIKSQIWMADNYLYGFIFKPNVDGSPNDTYPEGLRRDMIEKVRIGVFRLDEKAKIQSPVFKRDTDVLSKYNIKNKSVLLMPEANTCRIDAGDFWTKLGNRLHEKGYDILINAKEDAYNIDGSRCIFTDFNELAAIAGECEAVVALRSGACDILAYVDCDLYILNTSEYWVDKWNVKLLNDRPNIWNYLFTADAAGELADELVGRITG